jgi:enterochelin esterase-like enzyme
LVRPVAAGPRLPAIPHALRRWLTAALSGLVIAALAVTGGLGVTRYVSTFWLYRGFPAPRVPHSVVIHQKRGHQQVQVQVSGPVVENITVTSPALGGFADQVYVVLPPGYASNPRQRYPVLYLLHGFPGQPVQFLNVGQVAATEAALVAAGRMKPVILVMPTGTKSFLTDEEWANGISAGNQWETFVASDLVNAIDSQYRTIRSGSGRGIAGLSEGGYAALNIGLHHPGEFSLLESWSGYMMADHMKAIFGSSTALLHYNSPMLWVNSVAQQLRASRTYLWFYSGTRDYLTRQNAAFAAELQALGVDHYFFATPGRHNWALWRRYLDQALVTASGRLSHG